MDNDAILELRTDVAFDMRDHVLQVHLLLVFWFLSFLMESLKCSCYGSGSSKSQSELSLGLNLLLLLDLGDLLAVAILLEL